MIVKGTVDPMYKLSVAMTTYNGEKFVYKQLKSLYEQTRRPDQVIIIDDCSTDSTPQIVRDFIKEYQLDWHFEINESNLGYKKNFCKAISLTDGDIIFLCDQDDIWHNEKFETIENIFIGNPKVDCINTSFVFIDDEDKPLQSENKRGMSNNNLIFFDIKPNDIVNIDLNSIIRRNISPGCTVAFRSKIKDIYLQNTKHLLPHDWEINIYSALSGGLFFYNKPLISYRLHGNNTIGLSLKHINGFKFRGNFIQRLNILNEQIGLSEFLLKPFIFDKLGKSGKKFAIHLKSYTKNRQKCINNNSLISWFFLFKDVFFIYDKPLKSLRSTVGDLFYITGLKKK
ncbi:MAG TPA: glycosyltransferase [Clostridiales bacterium]|nr:glycosyltransferase [Clostridiales bacterium]